MRLPRFYPILDSRAGPWPVLGLAAAAAAMLEGGARVLQIRHKAAWDRAAIEEARAVVKVCREAGAVPIVNDRADVALLIGAGLHVGQDDLAPADARRLLGAGAVLGFSTHNPAQIAAADETLLTYLAAGPVFPTVSKQNPDPVVGVAGLRECRAATTKPLVAIGGITRANALAVLSAGADSVAVIGDLMPDPCNPITLRERIEEWQQLVRT